MIIKGLEAMRKHNPNLFDFEEEIGWPNGMNEVGDHDEDYVLDALFDIPNR
jgi:hypothetical protein